MKLGKNKIYLTSGQFAKICCINKKTLHYYDEIDLFKPSYINDKGYRYYSIFQLDKLAMIISLKDLGLSLKEIKGYLTYRNYSQLNDILLNKQIEIDQKIQDLENTKIFLNKIRLSNIEFQKYLNKGCQILYKEKEYYDIIYRYDDPNVKFIISNYLTDEKSFVGTCYVDNTSFLYKKCSYSKHYISEGNYLCLYIISSNEEIPQYIEQLKDYAFNHSIKIDFKFFLESNDILSENADTGDQNEQYFYCLKVKIKSEQ